MTRLPVCVFLLGVLIGLIWPLQAGASDRELLQRGIEQFDQGQFEEALSTLRRAAAASSDRSTLGRIYLHQGLALAVVGREGEARKTFTAALAHDPDLRLDAERYKPSLVRLFEAVRSSLQARLAVSTNRAGARVLLDGREVGRTPFEGEVAIGTHEVRVVGAGGSRIFSKRIKLLPGKRVEVNASLITAGAATPTAPTRRPPRRRRIWTWIAAGGAAAALAAGIVLWAAADADHDEFNTTQDPARYDELKSSIRTRDIAATSLLAAAGALAAASALLYYFEGHRDPTGRESSLVVWPTGLSWSRSF